MATMATTQSLDRLHSALNTKFPPNKVAEVIFFFNKLMKEARHEHWDTCINDGGKFVEAVLKCFHYLRTATEVDSILVDEEIRSLEQTTALNDFERLTIPGVLRLIYEFRNRRGGAYNTSFDPIKMDCVLLVGLSKWVVEELTRLYLTNDAVTAQRLVDSLLVKELPLVQELDGDRLVLTPGLSARVQLEILLWKEHSTRCSIKDLARWAHNHTIDNIRVTLRDMRRKNLAHETAEGWILTDLGIKEAETEYEKLNNDTNNLNNTSRVRAKGAKRGRK